MTMKDYYKILGIYKNASLSEVKTSFRKLALKYHPDKNPGRDASMRFYEITEAYEVLKNQDKRKEYDDIYSQIFSTRNIARSDASINIKQQKWTEHGKQKAEEYSRMKFSDFIHLAVDSAVFHGGYASRIGCVTFLFTGSGIFGLVMLPLMFSEGVFDGEDAALGIIVYLAVCIGFIYFGYNFTKNEVTLYKDEREKRKNNDL